MSSLTKAVTVFRNVNVCRRGSLHLRHHNVLGMRNRTVTTETTLVAPYLHRSYLYVPCSSERKLQKSLLTESDVLIYDLEDSISPAPEDKAAARMRLKEFLLVRSLSTISSITHFKYLPKDNATRLESKHIAVRVNDLTTHFFQDDISEIVTRV